jgi:alpha-tubulin suppressor-like RCC1 family protein
MRAGYGRLARLAIVALLGSSSFVASGIAVEAASATTAGGMVGWGEDYYGDLGTVYKTKIEETHVPVTGVTEGIASIYAGGTSGYALLSDGEAIAFGSNGHGQLGDHSRDDSYYDEKTSVPVEEVEEPGETLVHLKGIKSMSAANEHVIALMENGDVETWGNSLAGEQGSGESGFPYEFKNAGTLTVPYIVPSLTKAALEAKGLPKVVSVAAAGGTNYVVLENGDVMSWGYDREGQAGVNSALTGETCHLETGYQPCIKTPSLVYLSPGGKLLTEVASVTGGQDTAYALLKNGEVMAWGSNGRGEIGGGRSNATGNKGKNQAPTYVVNTEGSVLTEVVALAAGGTHVLALRKNGEVVGWGSDEEDQLGSAHEESAPCPCVRVATQEVAPAGLGSGSKKTIKQIAAGNKFNVALNESGEVFTWGDNNFGQLGYGGTMEATPTNVSEPGTVLAVAAGGLFTLTLLESGAKLPEKLISIEPKALAFEVEWGFAAKRLTYHLATNSQPGETEPTEVELEEEGEPKNVVPPSIEVPNAEEVPEVGAKLVAEKGKWSGARPLTFTYTWERCSATNEDECTELARQHTQSGELRAENKYYPEAADVGHPLRVLITVKNEYEEKGTKFHGEVKLASPPTAVVQEEQESEKDEQITLEEKEDKYHITSLKGESLRFEPYELHLESTSKVDREFRSTPLE